MITAFIPARGGSRGIPNKNIKEFADKPLIVHSIEYSLDSKYVESKIHENKVSRLKEYLSI